MKLAIKNVKIVEEFRKIEVEELKRIRNQLEKEKRESTGNRTFELFSLILLLRGDIRKRNNNQKTKPRYKGPFKIIELIDNNLYKVESEKGKKQIVHASRMVRFIKRAHLA
ncbi:hypothetical protein BB561_003750 [Smittium simulii]|uniref:Uncharacterized protein n=1 Tax=Smittium simulii TaxID=133385 RepID=A0A2T9YJS5_9FUNG|nr:hypothetical protein BB561_003750 [Smittium simulii]